MSSWFTEAALPLSKDGIKISVKVTDVLFDEQSEWAHLQVFDTAFFGRMLAIDGIIQVSESDEFIYHEMMTVLPSIQYGNPKNILIIGGGDGGALKHSLRVNSIEQSTQVEIDNTVSELCAKYLPKVSEGAFHNTRSRLIYEDAYNFVNTTKETFDIIVLDLTDPVPDGPAERLFQPEFIRSVKKILAPSGIVMMQCGSLLLQPAEVKAQLAEMKLLFASARLHTAVVPTYQLTTFGFIMASDQPLSVLDEVEFNTRLANIQDNNQYLDYSMYLASMSLPPYLKDQIL